GIKNNYEDAKTRLQTMSGLLKDVTDLAELMEKMINFADKANLVKLPSPLAKVFKGASEFSESNIGTAIGGALEIALDVANAQKEIDEVYALYGQIEENYAEYLKYISLLRHIQRTSELDYVRKGAEEIAAMFNEKDNKVDWDEFDKRVKDAVDKTLPMSAFRIILHGAKAVATVQQPWLKYVWAVVDSGKALFEILDLTKRPKAIVEAQTYYAVLKSSRELMANSFTRKGDWYEYKENGEQAGKYFVQMAQARIVGMNSVMEYLLSFKLEEEIVKFIGLKTDKEKISRDFKSTIQAVYLLMKIYAEDYTDDVFELSDGLPFYNDYWK
ncbi:MAG: hypothetical protein II832_10900, partial [Synergistaceae bacterium]|nr:hypothetical protein [Synergistaceae bacterium]